MIKNIYLKKLAFLNFKGGSETIEFTSNLTEILGANKAGKSRIFDAYCWLLFNKNSMLVTDFNVQNLDPQNNVIHKLEHFVEALFEVNGESVTLKRLLKEKWVTPSGKAEEEYRGCENIYYVNGVKLSTEREWNEYLSELFGDMSTFQLLSIPHAFTSLTWQQQRLMLYKIAGITSNALLCVGNNAFLDLIERMKSDNSAKYKKEVLAKINAISEQIEPIPTQIDENKKELEQIISPELSIEKINSRLEELSNEANLLVEKSKEQATSEKITTNSNKIDELRKQINTLQREQVLYINKAKEEFYQDYNIKADDFIKRKTTHDKLVKEYNEIPSKINTLKSKINNLVVEINDILNEYLSIKKETINTSSIENNCPTCGQQLPEDIIKNKASVLLGEFNINKNKRLNEVAEKGEKARQSLNTTKTELNNLSSIQDPGIFCENAPEMPSFDENQHLNSEIKTKVENLVKQIEEIEKENNLTISEEEAKRKEYLNSYQIKLKDIQTERESLLIHQQTHKRIGDKNNRISQLIELQKNLSQEKANLEKEKELIEEYDKFVITKVTNTVNHLFDYVEFKVFNILKNGNEEPTCTCMVNGVPFSDDNSASKVQSGLDIIKTLQKHFSINCPVFIDDRDLITDIPTMSCQIINLIVKKGCNKLIINNK